MYTKKTWEGFYGAFVFTGAMVTGYGIFFLICLGPNERMFSIGTILLGLLGFLFGLQGRIRRYRETHKDTNYQVDQNCEYQFTMQTSQDQIQIVKSFEQMQQAINELDQKKEGCVEIKIQPPMASIKQIDISMHPKEGYAYIWVLQQRKEKEGYWLMVCDKAAGALYDLKRLYVKHKPIDYRLYSRKETQE